MAEKSAQNILDGVEKSKKYLLKKYCTGIGHQTCRKQLLKLVKNFKIEELKMLQKKNFE